MLFDDNNVNLDLALFNLANISSPKPSVPNYNKNSKFLTAKEGFLRGNIFKDEYLPYKNLTYLNIQPKSDREAKLFNVMEYAHAITDMNLFLDTHPDDKEALHYLEELIKEEKAAKKEYMETYGPLMVINTKGEEFKWIDSPWPWEEFRGDIYV